MAGFYECFDCRKLAPFDGAAEPKCALCGGQHGQLLSAADFQKGNKSGVYFDIDPRTGKRSKPRRR
jgi:hypothetical protein